MTAGAALQRLLADTDAALPPPPARGLSSTALDRLLARRRRRTLLAAGAVTTAMALLALWILRPNPVAASPTSMAAAEIAELRARFDGLLARVDRLRAGADFEAGRYRVQLAIERAAVAGAQCAVQMESSDPEAAARHRAQIAALCPDTFAARNLPAPDRHTEEHR